MKCEKTPGQTVPGAFNHIEFCGPRDHEPVAVSHTVKHRLQGCLPTAYFVNFVKTHPGDFGTGRAILGKEKFVGSMASTHVLSVPKIIHGLA
jgi:hypothetical protein